jgi:hypothetical protein
MNIPLVALTISIGSLIVALLVNLKAKTKSFKIAAWGIFTVAALAAVLSKSDQSPLSAKKIEIKTEDRSPAVFIDGTSNRPDIKFDYSQHTTYVKNAPGDKDEFSIKQPIFGKIHLITPYGYRLTGTNNTGQEYFLYGQRISIVEGVPNPAAQDAILDFDVTNPNAMELRLVRFEIEVTQFSEPENLKVDRQASGGRTRSYFCNLQNKPGLYACKPLTNEFDFIKVGRNGKLEHFGINVNTRTPGMYELAIWIEYAIGTNQLRAKVGDVGKVPFLR